MKNLRENMLAGRNAMVEHLRSKPSPKYQTEKKVVEKGRSILKRFGLLPLYAKPNLRPMIVP